ncbi:MAG: GNAT family N-acetyltransferase [candidate division Zixibacteria bacterium]|nr:GNAT family N-acetyltransferase [Gammaproteobacteria bacterium]NIX56136.1 GNAT family N-acetyltransferase [candidate division Zixibacteria bacterium]
MLTVNLAQKEHGPLIKRISKRTQVFSKIEIETVNELWDEYLTKGKNSGYSFLISKINEDITGFICFGPHALTTGAYDIYWIAVDPDYQHRGVGSALIAKVEKEVENLNGNLLIIETSSTPSYKPARDFYTRISFIQEATIQDFYAPADHLVIFTKHLDHHRSSLYENHLFQEA